THQRQRPDAEQQGGGDEALCEPTLTAQRALEPHPERLEPLLQPQPLAHGSVYGPRHQCEDHPWRLGDAVEVERVRHADVQRDQGYPLWPPAAQQQAKAAADQHSEYVEQCSPRLLEAAHSSSLPGATSSSVVSLPPRSTRKVTTAPANNGTPISHTNQVPRED